MKRKASDTPAPDDRLELLFRHAGLAEKQAKLYRLLLDIGEARVSALSRRSGMKLGNTYALLRDLKRRGLAAEFEKDGVVHFRPEHPEKLSYLIEGRAKDIDIARGLAGDLTPELIVRWKAGVGRPVVRYFEGEEGIRKVFDDIYAPKADVVYGCVDLEKVDQTFPKYILNTLIPKRTRNNVAARSFVADSDQAREIAKHDKEQLRQTVLLDKETYPLPAEIDIYEDSVAMLSFRSGEFIGLVVENKDFAQSLRSIFSLAFDHSVRRKQEK